MASKHTFTAYGDGFWIKLASGTMKQVIDKNGYWVGYDITSTSPSTSPSTSTSSSPSTSRSTSTSSSPSTSRSTSTSSSPSAS